MNNVQKISILCIGLVCSLASAMDTQNKGAGILPLVKRDGELHALMAVRQRTDDGDGMLATIGGGLREGSLRHNAVCSFCAKTKNAFACNRRHPRGRRAECGHEDKAECAGMLLQKALGENPTAISYDGYTLFTVGLRVDDAKLAFLNRNPNTTIAKFVLVELAHMQERLAGKESNVNGSDGAEYTLWEKTADLLRDSEVFQRSEVEKE